MDKEGLLMEMIKTKKIIAIFITMLFCVSFFGGCGNTSVDEKTEDAITEEAFEEVEEPAEEIEQYVDDEVVNQFIIDYQNISGISLTDIQKGNIRTKYFAYSNDVYVEMLNALDADAEYFSISYSFGTLSEEEIYAFFTDCLKVFGATDEEIDKSISALTTENEGDYLIEDYEVNSNIKCTYCPTKELSKGKSVGHIEIHCSSYGK